MNSKANNFLRICTYLLAFLFLYKAMAADPRSGFVELPLSQSNFEIQKPYDVPVDQRYSFINGVHKFWVYKTDKPHTRTSDTLPRTEIRIKGYDYTSGVWQFEASAYVPRGTSGLSIMQIFGGTPPAATTAMLRVYDTNLSYYKDAVILSNVNDKWFRLNIIHNVQSDTITVYIDGVLKHTARGRGGDSHYFKFGVYVQPEASSYMESRWKDVKIFKKK